MNVQQMYYLRSLVQREHVWETETSLYFFLCSIGFFLMYVYLVQQRNFEMPSKIAKHAPDWEQDQNLLFSCFDIDLFLRYLCTQKYRNYPILIIAKPSTHPNTSYFSKHQTRYSPQETSKIVSWVEEQLQIQKNMPIVVLLDEFPSKYLQNQMCVCLQYVSDHSDDVWIWSQSIKEDSTLDSIIS